MRLDRRNLELGIGKLCDSACRFCGNGTVPEAERAWVPRAALLAEIERAAAAGYRSLSFLGGEILRYPHALDAVAAARRQGFERVALCTNGRRFADEAVLEAFLAAGVTRVTLSIHSHQEAVEDHLTGRPGAFAQKLAAVDHLVRAAGQGRLPDGFALNGCIHGLNCEQLAEMATFFHRRGVGEIRFNLLRPEHLALRDTDLVPRLARCVPGMVELMWRNERALRMSITFGDVPLCAWPDAVLGNARLVGRYLGELRDLDTSVTVFRRPGEAADADRFLWRERRATRLKGHAPACAECDARDVCEGPWLRYLELYGVGELHPLRRPVGDGASAPPPPAPGGRADG
ncbi:MAG: radical SAM protein [Deltaproteobacteria bacterium]|nr:radical SAM protein [Deltaproteobacteria bacterium]